MCEKLKGTILGKCTGDLNECEREAMEDLEEYVDQPLPFPRILQNNPRTILEIELTLKKGTSTPPTVYNKQKVETHMQDFGRLLRTLASERGMSSAHLRSFPHRIPTILHYFLLGSNPAAFGHFTGSNLNLSELPSLVKAISSEEGRSMVRSLSEDKAQALINVMDEACSTFARRCKIVDDIVMFC